jgi:hypothetical protein
MEKPRMRWAWPTARIGEKINADRDFCWKSARKRPLGIIGRRDEDNNFTDNKEIVKECVNQRHLTQGRDQ